MKLGRHMVVLEETTIEVGIGFSETVDRLCQQNGLCRETDKYGENLYFRCDEKGRISVNDISDKVTSRSRFYYVLGEVTEQDGKTAVKICSVYDKSGKYNRLVLSGFYIFAGVAYTAVMLAVKSLTKTDLLAVIGLSLLAAVNIFSGRRERQSKNEDFETMKNEIVKRVRAAEKWDD